MSAAVDALRLARRALGRLGRTLPEAVAYGLAVQLLVLTVAAPLVALVGRELLRLSGQRVLANTDIAAFALSVPGVAAGMVFGTLLLSVSVAGFAGVITMAHGAAHERSVGWLVALREVGRRPMVILRIAGGLLLRVAALVAPFVAAVAVVYGLLLSEHDINYYLVEQPAEWWWAVGLAALLGAILLVLLVLRCAAWLVVVPLVWCGGVAPRDAFRASRDLIAARRPRAVLLLAGLAAAVVVITTAATGLLVFAGSGALDLVGGGLRASVAVLGLFAALDTAMLLLLNILGTALAGHLAVALYEASLAERREALPSPPAAAGPLRARWTWRVGGGTRLLALAAIGGGAIAIAVGLLAGIRSPDAVRSIAHRAAGLLGPENTLTALRAAIAAGAQWAEIDVQRTADDQVVVVHDRDLMRLAGQPWRIADTPLGQLQSADLAGGEHVATLEEFITVARGKIGLLVELKYYGFDPLLAERVVALLRRHGLLADTEVMSLESRALPQLRALAPELRLGVLSSVAVGDVSRLSAAFVAVPDAVATMSLLAAAHRRGRQVYVWTLNDAEAISAAIDRGVDGIITDAPDLLAGVLAERRELSAVERLLLRFRALHPR